MKNSQISDLKNTLFLPDTKLKLNLNVKTYSVKSLLTNETL